MPVAFEPLYTKSTTIIFFIYKLVAGFHDKVVVGLLADNESRLVSHTDTDIDGVHYDSIIVTKAIFNPTVPNYMVRGPDGLQQKIDREDCALGKAFQGMALFQSSLDLKLPQFFRGWRNTKSLGV